MKIVVQVKLLPMSAHDADALAATLRACNRAANHTSQVAFAKGLKRRNVLQKEVYFTLKADYDLGAQPAVRVVKKVCDAYATQRARLHSWAFAQLGGFVEYKARRAGVPVVFVGPRNTSRQCSECWHTHRTNRVDQARFVCRSCGTVMHADHNGSRNIAHRGEAAWKRGAVNRPRTA